MTTSIPLGSAGSPVGRIRVKGRILALITGLNGKKESKYWLNKIIDPFTVHGTVPISNLKTPLDF